MESINLNLIPGKAWPVAHCSQFDIGRTIKVNLFEGSNVYTLDGTETVSVIVKKPDGNMVTASLTNTSDSYVDVITTEQMTACEGSNLAEIRVEKGDDVIGSLNFILECEKSPDTGIESDSAIHNFEAQVNQMVEDALASQYDSDNVIFDNLPTAGHGIPHTVTSEGIGNAIDNALDMTDTASGAIATFESEYALPLRDLEIEINAVQESGTPTPSSPKLISGFTGANIKVVGGNIWDNEWEQGTYNALGNKSNWSGAIRSKNFINIEPSKDYCTLFGTTSQFLVFWYKADNSFIGYDTITKSGDTVTSPATAYKATFSTWNDYGSTYNNDISINYPATTTAITWQSEAGTVYGGSLDVTSGVLTVTWATKDLTTLTWSYSSTYSRFESNAVSDIKTPANNNTVINALCSIYPIDTSNNTASSGKDNIIGCATNGKLQIRDTSLSGDTSALETLLTGVTFAYELATPITYQLTPTQISAIVGTNNVFTDTNGDTSLEYYAGNGEETAQVAEEIASVVVADYAAKVVKTKNGTFTNLLTSPLNSVWLICCQKTTTAGSGFVGIYSFDGVNLNPCVVYINGLSASFDSATGTVTVKYYGSTTDVYGSAFRLA